jgi:hypothetical protein
MTRRAAAHGALLLGGLAAILAGCSALDPYPTQPLAAPPGPTAMPAMANERVAICYNTLRTTLAEVWTQAQQECPANTVGEPADTDWYLENCPLLLPARATFLCVPRR